MMLNTQNKMIKLTDLQVIDTSLTLLKGNKEVICCETISHFDEPLSHTFFFIKSAKYLKKIGSKSKINIADIENLGCLIELGCWEKLSEDEQFELQNSVTWLGTVDSVDKAMCFLTKPFYDILIGQLNYQVDGRQMGSANIHPEAEISQNVFIGEDVTIEAGVKILPGCNILPKVTIKADTILFPNVTIYPKTIIGERCRIHAGTVIGADGFGYNFFDGAHQKIWHLAGVVIANDVEIGVNTMIDCGVFTPTYIGNGTKIDNDVQVAHNVKMGQHVIICGKSGLAGSVELEDYVAFGAGAGVAPSAKIGMGAQVAARGIVSENAIIPPKEIVGGHPARPVKEWMRSQAVLRKLSKK